MVGVHLDARLIIRDRACIVFIIRDVSRERSRGPVEFWFPPCSTSFFLFFLLQQPLFLEILNPSLEYAMKTHQLPRGYSIRAAFRHPFFL